MEEKEEEQVSRSRRWIRMRREVELWVAENGGLGWEGGVNRLGMEEGRSEA